MFRLVVLCVALVAAAGGQQAVKRQAYTGDPQVAAILQEQRYLSGDGTFGAAYQQEDGIDFKEESDAAGNRKGSYSYVDPSGQRRTVHYTAGKDGFRATGDHLPAAPAAPAAPPSAPAYTAPAYSAPGYSAAPAAGGEDDGQYHPELYERENYVAPQPQRSTGRQQEYRAPAPPAPPAAYPGVQQAQYSGVQSAQYAAPAAAAPQQRYYDATTPPPHRFFPPGKFNLNRSPDGYSYTFSKQ